MFIEDFEEKWPRCPQCEGPLTYPAMAYRSEGVLRVWAAECNTCLIDWEHRRNEWRAIEPGPYLDKKLAKLK